MCIFRLTLCPLHLLLQQNKDALPVERTIVMSCDCCHGDGIHQQVVEGSVQFLTPLSNTYLPPPPPIQGIPWLSHLCTDAVWSGCGSHVCLAMVCSGARKQNIHTTSHYTSTLHPHYYTHTLHPHYTHTTTPTLLHPHTAPPHYTHTLYPHTAPTHYTHTLHIH